MSDPIAVSIDYGTHPNPQYSRQALWRRWKIEVSVNGVVKIRKYSWTGVTARLQAWNASRNVRRSCTYEVMPKAQGDALAKRLAKLEAELEIA